MTKYLQFIDDGDDAATYPAERLISMTCAAHSTLLLNFESSVGGSTGTEHDVITLTLSEGAATGSITIVDLGSDTTDINNLHGTNGFTIVDTAGTSREYYFDKTTATGSTGTSTGDGIVIGIQSLSAASAVAAQVSLAINAPAGHNGTISTTVSSSAVLLTNSVGGPAGNVSINPGSTPTPTYITYSGMSGGFNIEKEVMKSIASAINGNEYLITIADDVKVAATANIEIIDTSDDESDTTNIEHLHGTNGFTLISTDATTKEYIFDKNNALGATGTVDAEGIVIQVYGMTAASVVANEVETAIEHSNGHNGKILVERQREVLYLTQNVAGGDGNTIINVGSLPVDNYIKFSGVATTTGREFGAFTNGLDGTYLDSDIIACSISLDS